MNYLKQIANGDMHALAALHETYKTPVCRLAFSMTKNRETAEDITQDTFLRIQEKAGTYRCYTSEAAWISFTKRCGDCLPSDTGRFILSGNRTYYTSFCRCLQ